MVRLSSSVFPWLVGTRKVGGFSHKDTIRHFAYHLSQGTGYRVGDFEAFLDNQKIDRIELFEHILFGLDGSSLLLRLEL
jgi:hypothetical protein